LRVRVYRRARRQCRLDHSVRRGEFLSVHDRRGRIGLAPCDRDLRALAELEARDLRVRDTEPQEHVAAQRVAAVFVIQLNEVAVLRSVDRVVLIGRVRPTLKLPRGVPTRAGAAGVGRRRRGARKLRDSGADRDAQRVERLDARDAHAWEELRLRPVRGTDREDHFECG